MNFYKLLNLKNIYQTRNQGEQFYLLGYVTYSFQRQQMFRGKNVAPSSGYNTKRCLLGDVFAWLALQAWGRCVG
jgi:hypothetical protein